MGISLGDLTKISLGVEGNKRVKQEYTEIAKDGIYYTYNNGAMAITQKQHNIPEGILKGSLAATIEETFKLEERIPFSVFLQIIQFYHDVVRENTTEASVLVYRNVNNVEIPEDFKEEFKQAIMEVGQFVVLVPNQVNSHGHTQFANFNGSVDESVHSWFEKNMVGVLETHSHCNFNAFWSGTDDKFEKHSKLRTFMVIGNNTGNVGLKMRYSYNYKYFEDFNFHELFTETGVYEEKKYTHSIVSKGLEKFIKLFKGKTEEQVTTRDLTWKEVLNELDLDEQPIEYPKEDWFARIKARPVTPMYTRTVGEQEATRWDESVLDDEELTEEYTVLRTKQIGIWDDEFESEEEYDESLLEEEELEEEDTGFIGVKDNFFGSVGNYVSGKNKSNKQKHRYSGR